MIIAGIVFVMAPKHVQFVQMIVGLALLIGSSRLLVWGAVDIAHAFGKTSEAVLPYHVAIAQDAIDHDADHVWAAIDDEGNAMRRT